MKKMIVVRPSGPVGSAAFESAREYFARLPDFNVLLVPYGFEVMVAESGEPEPTAELSIDEIEAARHEILAAYQAGKIVEYNPIADPLAGWIECHRFTNPHIFEWNDNYYRLPKRK